MRAGERVFLAKNVRNGGLYRLTESKYRKEMEEWEIVPEKVEEVVDDGPSYSELKDKLTDMGVEFKKNASKATLKTLLELESERL